MRAIKNKKGQYINRRRRQMICRRIITCAAALLFGLAIGLSAFYITSNAQDKTDGMYKYYTSITVYAGDSLSSIAEEYDVNYPSLEDFTEDVMYTNHMTDDTIIVGQSLIIPYYSSVLK